MLPKIFERVTIKIMSKIIVYLDNCTYNRPFDDQTQIMIALETEAKWHIQWLIVEKKIVLCYRGRLRLFYYHRQTAFEGAI